MTVPRTRGARAALRSAVVPAALAAVLLPVAAASVPHADAPTSVVAPGPVVPRAVEPVAGCADGRARGLPSAGDHGAGAAGYCVPDR